MLNEHQTERYSRQIALRGVGSRGQLRLLKGKVLIIGIGGLGSPAALYLAAAGVGTIGIVDPDRVELSNLQRQVIHFTSDLHRSKVNSAAEKILGINPEVTVIAHHEKITNTNISQIIAGYDFIIDGTDSVETKLLINDSCVLNHRPFSYGGVLQYQGQALTVLPNQSPCIRCLFPDLQGEELVPTCSRAGVLGSIPGIIGIVQATEAMKYLMGMGDLLTGRLLTYDALQMRFREIRFDRCPSCPLCNDDHLSGMTADDSAIADCTVHRCTDLLLGNTGQATPFAEG